MLSKKSSWYGDSIANEVYKMTNTTTIQMKDQTFSGKDTVLNIASRRISRKPAMPAKFIQAQP